MLSTIEIILLHYPSKSFCIILHGLASFLSCSNSTTCRMEGLLLGNAAVQRRATIKTFSISPQSHENGSNFGSISWTKSMFLIPSLLPSSEDDITIPEIHFTKSLLSPKEGSFGLLPVISSNSTPKL